MYQSYSALDLTQLQLLLDRVTERIQAQPGQSLVTIAGSLVGAYVVKRLLAPPAYPNLAGPPNMSALYGHTREIFSPTGLAFHDSIQDTYGSVAKVNGLMGREDLYISDPRALHEILVKEHGNAFQHDQFFYDSGNVFFGPGILATSGDVHKKQRKGTDAKSRIHSEAYESTFQQIADEMKKAIIKELDGKESKEVDILKWCSAAALELIGQAGFGHTFGIFQGVESEYTKAVKDFFPVLTPLMPFRFLFSLVYPLKPAGLRRKIVDWTPNADVQQIKHIIDIQDEQATAILNDKKARLADEGEEDAQDIISVLLKNNSQVEKAYQLPEDQIRGQINALVFAGHETTSGALTRTLDILSKHPNAQNRLRAELGGASSILNYDELQSLPYLDAVCREILRLYPPATQLVRRAYKDWVVPLRYPVKGNNGQEVREIQVKKGTMIYVALRQANRSRETWGDDADLFKPERWLGDLPSSVAEAKSSGIYSSMMTFSAGPRSCIGFKFAILELKVLLSTLIKTFSFAPAGHPVEWRLGLTMAPFEAGSEQGIEVGEQHPRMPIVVSLVD